MAQRRSVCLLSLHVLVCLLKIQHGYCQGQKTSVVPDTLGVKNTGFPPSIKDNVFTTAKKPVARASVLPPDTAGTLGVGVKTPKSSPPTNGKMSNAKGSTVAKENLLSPGVGELILPPVTADATQGVKSSSFSTVPKNLGFRGTIADTLALSELPHLSWGQNLGLNDMFLHEPMVQQSNLQQPIANTEVLPANLLFDRKTAQLPMPFKSDNSSFRYPGKPMTPNPMVSFISVGGPSGSGLSSRSPKRKSAVLLSHRSPVYSGPKRVRFNNWIDLKPFKTGVYKNPRYMGKFTGTPYQNPGGTLMTLLEAGSVANFENQFTYFALSQEPSKLSKSRHSSVFDSLFQDMDLTVDPCNDFYQFACGGFVANATRKNGVTNKVEEVKDHVIQTVKWVLKQKASSADPEVLVKGKRFYQSCMNEQSIEMRGLTPILNFLSDRGGWPVLGLWDPRRFNLVQLLAQTRPLLRDHFTHLLPTGAIIGMTVQRDFKRPGTHAIYFDQPSLGQLNNGGMPNNEVYKLGRDIIYNKAYEDYLVDVAVALGASPHVAKRDMCDVVNFERALAEIMLPEEKRRLVETRYRPISILEMSLMYPYFDWLRFIEQLLRTDGSTISVKLSNKVILWASPYFDRLGKVLSKTPKRVLANYVLFRAIQPMLPATSRLIQYINLRYTAVANGAENPKLPRRSDFCTGLVVENMDWLASRVYIESSLGKDATDHVMVVKEHVKQALVEFIERATWLDRQTKRAQLLKIRALKDRVGFPLKLLKDKLLNDYYEKFNITENFFENMEMVLRQNYAKTLQKLLVTPADDWIVRPSEVRTLYNSGANAIEIPAAFVHQPYIDLKYSPAMNFGGIGTLIANAYAHAYDVSGMKFDGSGSIGRLWSDQSLYQYGIRANCLVNQYSNYYLPDANLPVVNGNKTLNGNLPDNIAVEAGYYAFQAWKSANHFQELYDLPFTSEQLYFVNYARTMCQSATHTYTRKLPYSTLYSVPRLRVIGPLQNSREFTATFGCPLGSHMNPREKCSFW